jgi:hypothetical protein
VPIQKDPALGARGESRTEDCVGSVFHDRLQQTRKVGGVILEIGVLHQGHVAGHPSDRRADGGSLPAIDRMMENHDAVVRRRELLEDL